MRNYEDIFQDFDELSFNQWKESAIKTIKGADFDKKLSWKTEEGITVQPYYTSKNYLSDDLAIMPEDIYKPWDIIESIYVDEIKLANEKAMETLNNGATAIEFDLKNFPSLKEEELIQLLGDINTKIAPVFLLNTNSKVKIKNVYTHAIDGYTFKQKGANVVQEIAFIISKFHEQLISNPNPNIWLRMSTGSNYFMEIAKFQVIRSLCNTILEQYNLPTNQLYLQAISLTLNKSTIDSYTNMLRNTTEAMSSVLGGCNGISIITHDFLGEKKEMGKRIARNISLILQHESYFGIAPSPVAGTYYIQELSEESMEKAWNLFLEIEDLGGFQKAIESGYIKKQIQENREKQQQKIHNRSSILIGVNEYPDLTEKEVRVSEEIPLERWSSSFEEIRKKVHERKEPIKAYALIENENKMGILRYAYSVNFWGCAGIDLSKIPGKEIDEQITVLQDLDCDILVVCSSNESWNSIADKFKTLPKKGLYIIAGNTQEHLSTEYSNLINHSFYTGIDMVQFIQTILEEI